jgi:hypothetical protein
MVTRPEGCPWPVEPNQETGWLGREPTVDEQEIADWIASRKLPEKILHVGVGNAYLTKRFGARISQGLTKDGGEKLYAESVGLPAILCNKYDVASYGSLLAGPFDCIVDANIRSYSCCDRHFLDFMNLMHRSLTPDGRLITSRRGLDYLVPTSLPELGRLCPGWRTRTSDNVVILSPRGPGLIARIFGAR